MRKEDFNETEFHLKILLNASMQHSFRCLTTPAGLKSWFLGEVTYTKGQGKVSDADEIPAQGSHYLWKWQKDYQLEGTILSVQSNSAFAFTFGPDFKVQFSLEPQETKTLVYLHQINLDPREDNRFGFINCCVCWTFFLTNLKSVIENGVDLRETTVIDETFINQ